MHVYVNPLEKAAREKDGEMFEDIDWAFAQKEIAEAKDLQEVGNQAQSKNCKNQLLIYFLKFHK